MITRRTLEKLFRPFTYSIPSAILACLFVVFIILLSLFIELGLTKLHLSDIEGHWKQIAAFFVAFVGGALYGVLFFGIGKRGLRESTSRLLVPIRDSSILFFTAVCLIFAVIVWWIPARASSPINHEFHLIQHDPGGNPAPYLAKIMKGEGKTDSCNNSHKGRSKRQFEIAKRADPRGLAEKISLEIKTIQRSSTQWRPRWRSPSEWH